MPTPVSRTAIVTIRLLLSKVAAIVIDPVRSELQRVAQQVEHDLFDLLTVRLDRRHRALDPHRHGEVRPLDDRLELRHHFVDEIRNPEARHVDGIRPASMRVMSRMSLMSARRCRELESMRIRLLRCGSVTAPVTPCSSMWV